MSIKDRILTKLAATVYTGKPGSNDAPMYDMTAEISKNINTGVPIPDVNNLKITSTFNKAYDQPREAKPHAPEASKALPATSQLQDITPTAANAPAKVPTRKGLLDFQAENKVVNDVESNVHRLGQLRKEITFPIRAGVNSVMHRADQLEKNLTEQKKGFTPMQNKIVGTMDAAQNAWSGAKNIAGQAVEGAKNLVGQGFEGTKKFLGKTYDSLKDTGSKALNAIKNKITKGSVDEERFYADVANRVMEKLAAKRAQNY